MALCPKQHDEGVRSDKFPQSLRAACVDEVSASTANRVNAVQVVSTAQGTNIVNQLIYRELMVNIVFVDKGRWNFTP
jgi:hypothetical protein